MSSPPLVVTTTTAAADSQEQPQQQQQQQQHYEHGLQQQQLLPPSLAPVSVSSVQLPSSSTTEAVILHTPQVPSLNVIMQTAQQQQQQHQQQQLQQQQQQQQAPPVHMLLQVQPQEVQQLQEQLQPVVSSQSQQLPSVSVAQVVIQNEQAVLQQQLQLQVQQQQPVQHHIEQVQHQVQIVQQPVQQVQVVHQLSVPQHLIEQQQQQIVQQEQVIEQHELQLHPQTVEIEQPPPSTSSAPIVIPLHSSAEPPPVLTLPSEEPQEPEQAQTSSFHLQRDTPLLASFFSELCGFYRRGAFTDLSLQCSDGASVRCHKYVLAFVSKNVAFAVAATAGSLIQDAEGETVVMLPDFSSERVKQFVDILYDLLIASTEQDFIKLAEEMDQELTAALEMAETPSAKWILRSFTPPPMSMDQSALFLQQQQHAANSSGDIHVKKELASDDDDFDPYDNIRRGRSGRKRKRGLDQRELRQVSSFGGDTDDDWTPEHPDNFESYDSRFTTSKMKQEMYEGDPGDDFLADDEYGYAEKKARVFRRGSSSSQPSNFPPGGPGAENRFGLAPYKASDGPERGDLLEHVRATMEAGSNMMHSAQGTLRNVRWHRSGHLFQKKTYASIKKVLEPYPFRAIVAVSASNPQTTTNNDDFNLLRARPMAWSNPSKQEFIDSFDRMIKDFSSVYGFSEQELHCTSSILKFVTGLDNNTVRRKRKYIRNRDLNKLHKETRDRLKELLKNPKISQFRSKPVAKDSTPDCVKNILGDESAGFTLQLTKEQFETEACMVLLWDHRGRVTAKLLTLPNQPDPVKPEMPLGRSVTEVSSEDEISVDFLFCVLVGVWCSTLTSLPRAPEVEERIYEVESLSNLPEVVDKILNSEKPERQCPDCGDVFPYFTLNQKTNYHNHVTRHGFDKFQCDCTGITFKDRNEKREHALLKHSSGKYEQCLQCPFIGLKSGINVHYQECHKHLVCEECGKTFSETAKYNQHVNCAHRPSVCDICGEKFVGYARYRHHIDRFHNDGPFQCDQCPSVFKDKHLLRNHKNRMHQPDNQKKFQCDQCGKGFMTRQKVDQHRMNVHIKSRPYVCRFGCGAAYNDRSNQINHEKKKHANQELIPTVRPDIPV